MKSNKSHPSKSHAQGVVFEDVSDDDQPLRKVSFTRKSRLTTYTYCFFLFCFVPVGNLLCLCCLCHSRDPIVKQSSNDEKEDERSQKESRLSEMFPHLSRKKLSEVSDVLLEVGMGN